MENIYNDDSLAQDFEQIARAYSKHLKDKGFVFIKLEEEECNLLIGEIFVIIAKMEAALSRLEKKISSRLLQTKLTEAKNNLQQEFEFVSTKHFKCLENENQAFLSLISLENTLFLKLLILAVKSEKLETCTQIITSISSVFAESFSIEGFKLE